MITTLADLDALYGAANPASLRKETPHLTPAYQRMVEASPFCAVATSGPDGMDCSPRGDPKGFVKVLSERLVAMPDRRGNNRLDTLRNLISDPRIALLFLVPGTVETLRINGRAEISTDPALLAQFAVDDKEPKTVILTHISSVYFQCGKALVRSKLWDPAMHAPRDGVPTAGQMLKSADASFDGASYDAALPERQKATLY
jgi:uncharacterized protein